MRIRIEFDLDDEYADEAHPSGVTEEGNDKITEFVNTMGTNLEIEKVE